MSSGDVFEIEKEIDPMEEVREVAELFEKKILITDERVVGLGRSLEDTMRTIFIWWESKGTYLDLDMYKKARKISNIRGQKPLEKRRAVRYLAYVINMLSFYENYDYSKDNSGYYYSLKTDSAYKREGESINVLKEKVWRLLNRLGMDVKLRPGTKYTLDVFIKDAGVSEAIKVVEDSDVRRDILRYNDITVYGNPKEMRKILSSLYKDFELRREGLPEGGMVGEIVKDTKDLFNNLDIRHNPINNENTRFEVESMGNSKKIELYDRCFQLYITVVLISRYVDEHRNKIEEFRTIPK